MTEQKTKPVTRRSLLKGVAIGAATLTARPESAEALVPVRHSIAEKVFNAQSDQGCTPSDPNCDGRSPLPATDAAFLNTIVKTTNLVPKIRLKGNEVPLPFPRELLPIDAFLKEEPEFNTNSILNSAKQFKFWQVESLLDQAADLLDRCERERAEYDRLRTQWAKLILEVTEFDQLECIHKREITAGWYTLNFDQSTQEVAALTELVQPVALPASWHPATSPNPNNRGYKIAAALAQSGYDKLRDTELLGRLHRESGDGARPSIEDRPRIVEELNFKIQQFESDAQARSTEKLITGKQVKEAFDKADICFRRDRSNVAVLMNDLKKKIMSDAGGAYNYIEQSTPIRKRFTRDFRDALLRLVTANDGLNKIYDEEVSDFPFMNEESVKAGIFDRAVIWNREAIRRLVGLGHSDQLYVLSVSLKHLPGARFNDVLRNTSDRILLPFEFPAHLLQGQRLIRLRGLSAFVVRTRPNTTGLWHMTVRPPRLAVGPKGDSQLNQREVPAVHLGSVRQRESQQPAEIVGVTVLRNVSVLGHPQASETDRMWSVEIDRVSSTGEEFPNSVQDLQIDFHVAAQAV